MRTTTLLGRGPEQQRLATLVAGVTEVGGALLIRGQAGIGKSALLSEAAAQARAAGLKVLSVTGAESEQNFPYAGLHQLLHPLRKDIDALPGRQRDALRVALCLADGDIPDLYVVALATLNLLSDTGTPLLLLAEDAHWLDQASADVLAFVARRLESEPIVLLATVRDGVPSQLDAAALPSLQVEPLTDEVSATLLDEVAPKLEQSVRERLLSESAGNPLALTELPGTLSADSLLKATVPLNTRLEQAFGARTSALPAATRMCLLVASLNDRGSLAETLDAAAAALGVPVDADALTPATEARLIELEAGRLTFRHPLMRSAIVQTSTATERQAAHRALADALHQEPERQVWHLAAATPTPDENIASALVKAAERAQYRGGVEAAIASLEEAARLSETADLRADRLLRAADLGVEAGRPDVVKRLLIEASQGDLSQQDQARATWVRSSFDDGLVDDTAGPTELAKLARSVYEDGDLDLAMRILWGAGMRCFWSEPGAEGRQHLLDVADSLPLDDGDPRLIAILAYVAPIERGKVVAAGLMDLAGQTGGNPMVERFLGSAALQIGAFELSARFSSSAAAGLREQGRLGLLARALAVHACSAVRLGNLDIAMPAAEEAARLAKETNQTFMYGFAVSAQAEVAALRGQYAEAAELIAEAEQVGLAAGARPVLATVQLARGLVALGEGRHADAFADLHRIFDPAEPSYQLALRCYVIAELAEAAIRCGQEDAVRKIVKRLEKDAQQSASPSLHIGLRYVRAVLANDDEAEKLFQTALAADLTGWPLERGRLQLAYGEWLRRHRQAAESRVHLRAARETFDALGLIPWSERARSELRAAGETSPRRTPDAREQLTPHELSIAQLAAEGLTNREIGQRLYLSHRTVSTHLHRIFPKLGITSRADLPAVLRNSPA
ncbi:LuxR family transcriptional regulator [Streptomyces sp. SID13031]|uniref:AAA family ATPase n=1 Tax=Streptomyces sp. SID13031 TaxID=2706046 RepID=UPI0013C5B48C|nr:helix-turn-helix domain-containing protein [Streptomyces sp. SID13031]